MVDKRRRSDPDDSVEYKSRTFVDLRSVLLIIAALSGGSLTDLGLTYFKGGSSAPVVERQVQKAVDGIEKNREYIDNYIKAHEAIEVQKDVNITNSLNDLKEDVNELKQDIRRVERLIRNGQPH